MIESLTVNPFFTGVALTLLHFIWQGILVAFVLKVLLSFISFQKSNLRYALSSIAMLLNLFLPIITLVSIYAFDYHQTLDVNQSISSTSSQLSQQYYNASQWYSNWADYLPLVTIVWISIVSLLATKLLIELYYVNKLSVTGTYNAEPALQARFEQLMEKIVLPTKASLLISKKVDVPMAIGWLKPVVLLPMSMLSGLTPQQLDMLILHELAHIRRHDYLVNFLQTLVETLLFFHPAVRWVSKQMRNEREYCSDDIAVQHSSSAVAYAHTLADTASLCQQHRQHSIPTMAMAASGGDLKQRVTRLISQPQHCNHANNSGKWLASLTALLAVTLAAFQQSLPVPVIDFKTGSISLSSSKNNSHVFNRQNAKIQTFSPLQSPLAEQLVAITAQDKTQHTQASINTPIAQKASSAQEIADSLQSTTPASQETTLEPTQQAMDITKVGTPSIEETVFSPDNNVEKSLATTQASISELAFKRTDSSIVTSKVHNPYAEQIALLEKPPHTLNTTLELKERVESSANTSVIKKSAPLTPLNSERFTAEVSKQSFVDPAPIAIQSAAQLLTAVEPRYPNFAKRKGIELELKVEFDIDKYGFVQNLKIESKSKANYFRKSIRTALAKWRFLPAKENGQAVESKMSKIFSFSLLK